VGEHLGNVLEEPIAEIWRRYRFKKNHVSKYVGRSIHAVPRGLDVLERTNLGWPETPFGSVTRPVQNPATWLTGLSLLWGETGDEAVLMGAAAVFMKVHRTRSLPVAAELATSGTESCS